MSREDRDQCLPSSHLPTTGLRQEQESSKLNETNGENGRAMITYQQPLQSTTIRAAANGWEGGK
ncbi:hypothetical protein PG994_004611 [Apiospora phragmitis]|uniref:Uncharacterized protein n=1 Tax=Apiospora phragmitis TaxID=2905665 RepID=A0ABR1VR67_9PEZI